MIVVVLGATLLSNTPTTTIAPPTEAAPEIAASAIGSLLPGPVGTPFLVAAGDVRVVQRDRNGSLGYGTYGVEFCLPEARRRLPDGSRPVRHRAGTRGGAADDHRLAQRRAGHRREQARRVERERGHRVRAPEGERGPGISGSGDGTAGLRGADRNRGRNGAAGRLRTAVQRECRARDAAGQRRPDRVRTAERDAGRFGRAERRAGDAFAQETDPITPTPTPESIAIASDLIVIGQTAAYSPDGNWFAFTARPADESHGPDIYLWRVGSERAEPVTEDHNSVFASWTDGQIVGSRPFIGGDTSPEPLDLPVAEVFLLDPESGEEEVLAEAGFRPIVSPDGRLAIVFSGPVSVGEDSQDPTLGEGTLELRSWNAAGASAEGATRVLDGVETPFDARWDESGTAFALWVQDHADPSFGRLSLFFIDQDGEILQPENAPQEEPALPGFSIGDGRLAWATPAGQGGEGSRVQIVAWTDEGVGTAETAPGDQVVVIR